MSSAGRSFLPPAPRTLRVCYGSPDSVRSLTGCPDLIGEFSTALFTAAALAQEAPHDCEPWFWLNWVRFQSFDAVSGEDMGGAGGGGACPCDYSADCPLDMFDAWDETPKGEASE